MDPPLAYRQNVASLNLLYSYYFRRCSYELTYLVPLRHSYGRSARFDRLHDFSVTTSRCSKNVYGFIAQLDSGVLCIECFPVNYDLMTVSLELANRFFRNRFFVCF